jgi:hypothetical protein
MALSYQDPSQNQGRRFFANDCKTIALNTASMICDKVTAPRTYFSSLIDDIRIYNRAVTP